MNDSNSVKLSVVIIGRNEGARLEECLKSVLQASLTQSYEIIYVDSNSTDQSVEIARKYTSHVLTISGRLTAAKARNVGWKSAQGDYILFLDADTLLNPKFVEIAMPYFDNPKIAVVCGYRDEMKPEESIYNLVMDVEWKFTPGYLKYCGGDAIMRKAALIEIGGYIDDLLASEDVEMCRRLRLKGYMIYGLDIPMTRHDVHILKFVQYWKRCMRTGYAYAEVNRMTKEGPDPLFYYECVHNALKILSFILILALSIFYSYWFLLLFILLPLWSAWQVSDKCKGKSCLIYGLHAQFAHIPLFFGQLIYFFARIRGKKAISYK